MHILDLRSLADEWYETLEQLNPENLGHDPSWGEVADVSGECAKYEDLCDVLGIEQRDPDGLRGWANDYEPTLIAEDDFPEYAQQLAEEIGAISSDAQWPLSHIDWEAAAAELEQDYTHVEYDGIPYLMRS